MNAPSDDFLVKAPKIDNKKADAYTSALIDHLSR